MRMREPPRPNLAPHVARRARPRITGMALLRFVVLGISLAAFTVGLSVAFLFGFASAPIASGALFLFFGIPTAWGWSVLLDDVRARLRPPPPGDPAALPPAFHTLAPELQALVRHTRSLRAVVQDPELEPAAVIGVAFEWLTAVSEVRGEDRYVLVERHLDAASVRPHVLALNDAEDPRGNAADLFDRFVVVLIGAQPDPYRGGLRRAVRDPSTR